MKHPVYIIVAVDEKNGIGIDGKLPWHFSNEMKYFAHTTRNTKDPDMLNMVIMGRKTWESIPEQYRPLSGRLNVVLSKNPHYYTDEVEVFSDIEHAINSADDNIESIFIIGGGKVFDEALKNSKLSGIYLTKIHKTYECDTFFPTPNEESELLDSAEENGVKFDYLFFKSSKTS